MAVNHSQQAVAAKVRARYGRFFTPADYGALAASAGVADLLGKLREHPDFAQALSKLSDTPEQDSMEHIFKWHLYEDLASLFRFDRFLGSPLYRAVTDYMTVEILLSFIRHYNAGTLSRFRPAVPEFFRQHSEMDFDRLLTARSYPELLAAFHGHPYLEALAAHIPAGEAKVNLTALEFDLLKEYYRQVFTLFSADKKEYKGAWEIFAVMVDLDNLQMILRRKRYYEAEAPSPEFFQGGTLSVGQLNRWCALSYDALITQLKASRYGRYFTEEIPPDFALKRMLYDHCRKCIRSQTEIPCLLIAYTVLARSRRECLVTISQGLRYGMTPDAITALLPIGGAAAGNS